jgi:hypothetical protein
LVTPVSYLKTDALPTHVLLDRFAGTTVSGRSVSVFKLKEALVHGGCAVKAVELLSPEKGKPFRGSTGAY